MSDFIGFASSILNLTKQNGEIISNNISNVNTPDYKAKELQFNDIIDAEMKSSLKSSDERHITKSGQSMNYMNYEVVDSSDGRGRVDGNNVDQTKEMIRLLENNNKNNLAINSLNSELNLIRTAIGR